MPKMLSGSSTRAHGCRWKATGCKSKPLDAGRVNEERIRLGLTERTKELGGRHAATGKQLDVQFNVVAKVKHGDGVAEAALTDAFQRVDPQKLSWSSGRVTVRFVASFKMKVPEDRRH